ncbi:MAG: copper homeostasis protein CutC [Ferruginibacter sp.]
MNYTLEVIAFTIDCCIKIEKAGAHRIELCSNPQEGGTTPSHGFISQARKKTSLELFAIIRPRGGDFVYSKNEYEVIKEDIDFCKKAGCEGIVTGMLYPDGRVDKIRCKEIVSLAYPMSVTFHRAFDRTKDPYQALEDIIETGCERILTSGFMPTAIEAISLIENLVKKAEDRIIIMPGSGIRSGNILKIANSTGAVEFHTSARKSRTGKMEYYNEMLKESFESVEVDDAEVKKIISILTS